VAAILNFFLLHKNFICALKKEAFKKASARMTDSLALIAFSSSLLLPLRKLRIFPEAIQS